MPWRSFTQTPTLWPVGDGDMGQGNGVGKALPSSHLHHPCCSPAGALKSYLRELPQPLMTFELYDEWVKVARWVGEGEKPHGAKKAHGYPALPPPALRAGMLGLVCLTGRHNHSVRSSCRLSGAHKKFRQL